MSKKSDIEDIYIMPQGADKSQLSDRKFFTSITSKDKLMNFSKQSAIIEQKYESIKERYKKSEKQIHHTK